MVTFTVSLAVKRTWATGSERLWFVEEAANGVAVGDATAVTISVITTTETGGDAEAETAALEAEGAALEATLSEGLEDGVATEAAAATAP
jgi:hypothetical protein